MNPRLLKENPSTQKGFALIATVSVMVLLVMVAMGVMSLSTRHVRSSKLDDLKMEARANARMAMVLALGELQEALGPDQRVSAVAELLSDDASAAPRSGRSRWLGVWDTKDYDPLSPDQKKFVKWLVSAPQQGELENESSSQSMDLGDECRIFSGVSGEESVWVEKVDVEGGAYAYWVEDEGVKADLGWRESESSGGARQASSRLSSAFGVDAGVFGGPFAGEVAYPISRENNGWIDKLEKAHSSMDAPLLTGYAADSGAWSKAYRHDVTLGSLGLLVDVKNGGLKRDLSLAFEMDGDADVGPNEQPDLFNQQVGEFVGGEDDLQAPRAALGMQGHLERYLYRISKDSVREPYVSLKADLQRKEHSAAKPYSSVVRGPNWWALRDYYNLYKRIEGSAGNYTLPARAYYPNRRAINSFKYTLGEMMGKNSGDGKTDINGVRIGTHPWDHEFNLAALIPGRVPDDYIYRPAAASYAPVLLGMMQFYSVTAVAEGGKHYLALGVDPVFYFWNPFDVELVAPALAVSFQHGTSGHITLWKNSVAYGPNISNQYLWASKAAEGVVGEWKGKMATYLAKDVRMQPGEVKVYSPSSARSGDATMFNDELVNRVALDNQSGVVTNRLPVTHGNSAKWEKVELDVSPGSSDVVKFTYSHQELTRAFTEVHFRMNFNMPSAQWNADDLVNKDRLGDELQSLGNHIAGSNLPVEYFEPSIAGGKVAVPPPSGEVLAGDLWNPSGAGSNIKHFFAVRTYMAKPANYAGEHPNPVEVFSQFNPMPLSTTNELWRKCMLNQFTNSISIDTSDPDTLKSIAAIEFPATNGKGFWGETMDMGSTSYIFASLPTAPMLSLADFTHANLGVLASEPYKAAGNSLASLFVPSDKVLGFLDGSVARFKKTAADRSWLINDALFDRYYFSGLAPEYSIGGAGYKRKGSLGESIAHFFDDQSDELNANPAILPHVPNGMDVDQVLDDVDPGRGADEYQGYKKLGAYSMVSGAFNVNSTSVKAWEALLRVNKGLKVIDSAGATVSSGSDAPFPSSMKPPSSPDSDSAWQGFAKLSDREIKQLAENLVEEVKKRGPFMSLSDFVNRKLSTDEEGEMGAIQAALERAGVNKSSRGSAGGVAPVYSYPNTNYYADAQDVGDRKTSSAVPTEVNQADVLRLISSRISVRSDTFKIRAYGEVKDESGKILATAICETTVQRLPEYFDPVANEPWDDDDAFTSDNKLSEMNARMGRRFRVLRFRWLDPNEI